MAVTRTKATKLRWTVTACLLVATASAGALVAMSNSSNYGSAPETTLSIAR
jgi:hypothetical protein